MPDQPQKHRNRSKPGKGDDVGNGEHPVGHRGARGHDLSLRTCGVILRKITASGRVARGAPTTLSNYREGMSCIRFNTPAQKEQLESLRVNPQAHDAVAQFLSPPVSESKIKRLRRMAADPNPKIRESAALSYHAPAEVYEALADDPDEGVRQCLARNPYAPCDVLRKLANDRSEKVRAFVAVNYQVPADAMDKLADDPSETVQALVAWKDSLREPEPLSV